MALDTYTNLQAEIAAYLARDDLTSKIPDFITLFEAKANRTLRCREMEQRSTASVDLDSDEPEFISLPTDYQSMRRVRITSVTGKPRLYFLPSDLMDEKRFASADTADQPSYFSVFGTEMELFPTPSEAYTLEMVYRKNIPALASNSTNWLLTNHPDAYLYGALLEASPYMRDDERVQLWTSALSIVIDQINSISNEAAFNAGPLQMYVSGVATP